MIAPVASLWNDDAGFIVSIELILIATISVIGLIVGFTAIRDAVVSELSDVAGAIQDLNHDYSFNAVTSRSARTDGSNFVDRLDFNDSRGDRSGSADNCIEFTSGPSDEQ